MEAVRELSRGVAELSKVQMEGGNMSIYSRSESGSSDNGIRWTERSLTNTQEEEEEPRRVWNEPQDRKEEGAVKILERTVKDMEWIEIRRKEQTKLNQCTPTSGPGVHFIRLGTQSQGTKEYEDEDTPGWATTV